MKKSFVEFLKLVKRLKRVDWFEEHLKSGKLFFV